METLIINMGLLKSGTALTAEIAREYNNHLLIIQLDQNYQPSAVSQWINENQIEILNVAGSRESKVPGIYDKAKALLGMEFQQTIYLTT